MSFIAEIPLVGGLLANVIPFLIALSVVVFVHEYGHYIVGRLCGIHARKFSVGFGPALLSRTDRRGTVWQVAAIPLGGMVQFLGDADGASREDREEMEALPPEMRAHTFHGATVGRRAATVAAGPVFNFVLSAVLFAGLAVWTGVEADPPAIGTVAEVPGQENPVEPGDRILSVNGEPVESFAEFGAAVRGMEEPGPVTLAVRRDGRELTLEAPYPMAPLVSSVLPFSAASRAELRGGDLITSVDGEEIIAFRELLAAVETSEGRTLTLGILRDGERMEVALTPQATDTETEGGGFEERYRIGVSLMPLYTPATETPGPLAAAAIGAGEVWRVITGSLNGIKHIILGNLGADNLQGPIGIAQISGESARQGVAYFVNFVAVISTAIGLLNLFPIPILDGGHLALFAYEAVVGRPPPERVLGVIMPVGLAMVLLLMLFATYNDLIRLAASLTS